MVSSMKIYASKYQFMVKMHFINHLKYKILFKARGLNSGISNISLGQYSRSGTVGVFSENDYLQNRSLKFPIFHDF